MALILRPPGEKVPLTEQLGTLAAARQFTLIVTGLLTVSLTLLGLLLIFGFFDSWLHLASSTRAFLLTIVLTTTALLYFRGIHPHLRRPASPLSVAQLLESQFPHLNDSLASAICFLSQDPESGAGASNRFREVAVRRAEVLAERTPLNSIVPSEKLMQSLLGFGVVGLLSLAFLILDFSHSRMALERLFDPYGNHSYPAQTTLELLSPATRPVILAKGSPFPIAFKLTGRIPEHATLSLHLTEASIAEERIELVNENAGSELSTRLALEPDRVSRDFRFRIQANDADTGWIPVTVSPPPRLVPWQDRPSPQYHLDYPAYTRLPAMDLPDGSGMLECVSGTQIRLTAAADRRIVSADLHFQGERAATELLGTVAPLSSQIGLTALGSHLLAEQYQSDIPVEIDGDGTFLSVNFTPTQSGIYALRFRDESGLLGVRLLDIRTFEDPSPTVTQTRPVAGRDPLIILPTGKITIQSRAEDPTFAIRSLFLEYRVGDSPFRTIPLTDASKPLTLAPAIVGGIAALHMSRPISMTGVLELPVATCKNRDGNPPIDGDTVFIRSAANDWDDHTLLKTPGRSAEVAIQILSSESITAQIQRELAGLRPELARTREQQKEAIERMKEFRKAVDSGKLTEEDREKLGQIAQNQRQIRAQISDPRDGTRSRIDRLREVARQNQLPRSSVTERAEAVARDLESLDRQHLQDIEQPLAQAKQATERPDAKGVKEPLAKAAQHQKGSLEKLDAALEELEQWAGAAEVRGEARNLKDQTAQSQAAARKNAEKIPQGMRPEQLSPEQQSNLNRVADDLEKMADQAGKLMTKAERVAQEKREQAARDRAAAEAKAAEAQESTRQAGQQPKGSEAAQSALDRAAKQKFESQSLQESAARAESEAQALEQAARRAGGQQVPDQLKRAASAERQNRPSETSEATAEAMQRLNRMVDSLAEKREDTVDRLAKKKKEAAEQIDQLADKQDRLNKKLDAARKEEDPGARADQMRQLAEQQDQLRREAEQLSRKLDRDGSPESAEELRRATDKMEQAQQNLADGQDPEKKSEEALDRLEQARDQVEQKSQEEQEQLLREKREQIAEQIKGFVERQRAALQESERLTQTALKEKRWSRPLQTSLVSLADRQKGLSEELRSFVEKKLADLKIFQRMAQHAADNMQKGSKRLLERKEDILLSDPNAFDAESETVADEVARKPLRNALTRLEQIAAALKEDDKKKPMPKPMQGGGEGGGGGGGGGGPGGGGNDGVSPLAQLKALRDWQKDINLKTSEFAKDHPDPTKLSDDEKDDLKELEQAQKEIGELFEQMLPFFQGGAGF